MPSIIETPQDTNKSINCKEKTINLDQPIVMGILNLTPDSFFDGGKYHGEASILEQVNSMEYDGATIIDIGGYSSRPGANEVSEAEEIQRIIPIIKLINQNFKDLVISVDTFRSKVAQLAVNAGASMINDISGGNMDDGMFDCIADLKVPYVLMHMQGTPQSMQENPTYTDVVQEVKAFFTEKIAQLNAKGITNIILDPGFGFGKTVEHNFELLNHLGDFKSFGLPILAGVSRKSMINKVLKTTPKEALNGTTILNTIALQKGANILRVHDIKEAIECVKLVNQLQR
jgi:dihydropteroate synthase